MLIKHGYFVETLYLHNRKSPITYTYGGAHSIKVLLKQASKKNSPIKKSDDVSICKACGTFKPSEKMGCLIRHTTQRWGKPTTRGRT